MPILFLWAWEFFRDKFLVMKGGGIFGPKNVFREGWPWVTGFCKEQISSVKFPQIMQNPIMRSPVLPFLACLLSLFFSCKDFFVFLLYVDGLSFGAIFPSSSWILSGPGRR